MRHAKSKKGSVCFLLALHASRFTPHVSLSVCYFLSLLRRGGLRRSCLTLCKLRRLCRRWLIRRRRRHVDGIRLVDALFEPLDGFSQPFAQLGDFAGPEDDQDDDQNQEQFHPAE